MAENRSRSDYHPHMFARLALLTSFAIFVAQSAHGQDTSPDETMWAAIEALARSTPASQPFEARFDRELSRRRALLEKTRSYLRIYPGGHRRDEAIALELETLFEIGTLSGDYTLLAERIRGLESAPPSDAARAEAAWWQIHCDRAQATATRPAATSLEASDAEVLAAFRSYAARFPDSRHALRALLRLAHDALDRGEQEQAAGWVGQLEARFADNALVAGVAARLRMARNVGQPFTVVLTSIDGAKIDTGALAGNVVIICIWDSTRPASRETAREVEAFLAAAPSRRAVGVCIADSVESTRRAIRDLTISWPQCNDGLGRGGELVRRWGVRSMPGFIVIDPQGRLAGCADKSDWRKLAERAGAAAGSSENK